MTDYPVYACRCCGFANSDMFYDHYYISGKEPTKQEVAEFKGYKKAWGILSNERRKAREIISQRAWPEARIGRRLSDETRAKISATKKQGTR